VGVCACGGACFGLKVCVRARCAVVWHTRLGRGLSCFKALQQHHHHDQHPTPQCKTLNHPQRLPPPPPPPPQPGGQVDHPLAITEPVLNPTASRAAMAELVFETYGAAALHLLDGGAAAFSLYHEQGGCVLLCAVSGRLGRGSLRLAFVAPSASADTQTPACTVSSNQSTNNIRPPLAPLPPQPLKHLTTESAPAASPSTSATPPPPSFP